MSGDHPKLDQCTVPLSVIKCVPRSRVRPRSESGRLPRDPDSAGNCPSAEAVPRRPKPWVSDMVTSGYDDPDRNPIERYHTSNDGQMDEMRDLFIQLRTVSSTTGSCCRKRLINV